MTSQRPLSVAVACLATMALPGASRVAAQDAALLNPVKGIDKVELRSFLERPLFDQSRQLPIVLPRPVAIEAPAALTDPPPKLHLLGVIHGKSDIVIAQRDGEQKTTILKTGDRIGDWVLTVFPPVGVRLRNGARVFDYKLFDPSNTDLGTDSKDKGGATDDAAE